MRAIVYCNVPVDGAGVQDLRLLLVLRFNPLLAEVVLLAVGDAGRAIGRESRGEELAAARVLAEEALAEVEGVDLQFNNATDANVKVPFRSNRNRMKQMVTHE